jgi:hypothetical protein
VDRRRADSISLNHDIVFVANHQKVLHVVATDESEAALLIDRGWINHGEPWLAWTEEL